MTDEVQLNVRTLAEAGKLTPELLNQLTALPDGAAVAAALAAKARER